MAKNPLDSMSLEEIQKYMERRKANQINELRAKWETEAAEHGLTFFDVIGGRPGIVTALTRTPAPIKYRNPDDASDVWSGRGVPPKRWAFLYDKDGKPIKPLQVDAMLDKKGWKVKEAKA